MPSVPGIIATLGGRASSPPRGLEALVPRDYRYAGREGFQPSARAGCPRSRGLSLRWEGGLPALREGRMPSVPGIIATLGGRASSPPRGQDALVPGDYRYAGREGFQPSARAGCPRSRGLSLRWEGGLPALREGRMPSVPGIIATLGGRASSPPRGQGALGPGDYRYAGREGFQPSARAGCPRSQGLSLRWEGGLPALHEGRMPSVPGIIATLGGRASSPPRGQDALVPRDYRHAGREDILSSTEGWKPSFPGGMSWEGGHPVLRRGLEALVPKLGNRC